MTFCGRCGKPILPGQQRVTHDVFASSGPGRTIYLHAELCKRPYTRTTQTSVRH